MQFLRRSSPDLDRVIETTKNAINTTRTELDGCHLQRFGNLALALEDVLDRLYLPNIRGNEAHIPLLYRYSNKIPVIPQTASAVTLATGFNEFGRTQYHNAIRQAKTHQATSRRKAVAYVDNIHNRLRNSDPFVVDVGEATALTVSLGALCNRKDHPHWPDRVTARPAIFMDVKTADPGTATHEIVHVLQNEQQPFTFLKPNENYDQNNARNELEAHHAGAIVEKAGGWNENYLVEYARSQININHPDPFYPDNLMRLPYINKALKRKT